MYFFYNHKDEDYVNNTLEFFLFSSVRICFEKTFIFMYITDILQNKQESQQIDKVKEENDTDSGSENQM